MLRLRVALLAVSIAWLPAYAQPVQTPAESVTVTGTKSREVIQSFVASLATPTRVAGKIGTWESGVCPAVEGLRAELNRFVIQRIREVATKVGAPANGNPSCTPNVAVQFTSTPQAIVDTIRKKHPNFLGYYDSTDQLRELATVTRPIQSWYATATRSMDGTLEPDRAVRAGIGLELTRDARVGGFTYSNATSNRITGSHLGDGLQSRFYNVTIVADRTKLVGYEIGAISDYISMLALAQLSGLETCQQLPSIVNMFVTDCDHKSSGISDNDLGFLSGLYKMNTGRTARTQQDEIAYQMEQSLTGR